MKEKLRQLKQDRDILIYIFFGALTTLVNYVVYGFSYYQLCLENVVSTSIAWAIAVTFAFVTNKIWVFHRRNGNIGQTLQELICFVGSRITTGLIELGFMYLTIDIWNWYAMTMKVFSNVFVMVMNYIISKYFIFNGEKIEE